MKKYDCLNCGCEVSEEEIEMVGEQIMVDQQLCEECFYNIYTFCDNCGCTIERDEAIYIEDDGYCYCEECVANNDNVFYCAYHEKWEKNEDNYCLSDGEMICIGAIDDGVYDICSDCGCVVTSDYLTWSERDETYYCDECIDDHRNEYVKSYHEHEFEYEDHMKCTNEDKENRENLYFGMELEIEATRYRYYDHDELAEEILNLTDDFAFEEDGSLNNGFEIISYPFTRNYMKETLENTLEVMLRKIRNYQYEGKYTCGLHFHVSREAVKDLTPLVTLVEYFKEELIMFSRRDIKDLNKWSPFHSRELDKNEITKEFIDQIVADEECHSRYHAINLDNYSTIEFRIFKSTTDFKELMATWELVNNMVAYANNEEVNLNSMPSFIEVATYQENNYVEDYMENLGIGLATC